MNLLKSLAILQPSQVPPLEKGTQTRGFNKRVHFNLLNTKANIITPLQNFTSSTSWKAALLMLCNYSKCFWNVPLAGIQRSLILFFWSQSCDHNDFEKLIRNKKNLPSFPRREFLMYQSFDFSSLDFHCVFPTHIYIEDNFIKGETIFKTRQVIMMYCQRWPPSPFHP